MPSASFTAAPPNLNTCITYVKMACKFASYRWYLCH
jgi:hypothetical protein